MAKVLAIVTDLMLASRVEESLRAAGHEVTVTPSLPDPLEADAVVCDLDTADIEAVAAAPVPTLVFYSHIDVETKKSAEAAGITQAIPRSRMARELPDLVAKLLER
jgi:hypothetical protein